MVEIDRDIEVCSLHSQRKICSGATSLDGILTWLDESYAVHHATKSHDVGAMSMGLGVTHCILSKKNLNINISTEAELVGASDYLPYNIWWIIFMHHQGYLINYNNIFQDNQRTISMEVNGSNSCTRNQRHIDIRYLFIKDRVDKEELSIVYCPSHLMLADYFTKTLQGEFFHKFRGIITGRVSTFTLIEYTFQYKRKERVGKNIPLKEIPSGIGEPLKDQKYA